MMKTTSTRDTQGISDGGRGSRAMSIKGAGKDS